MCFLKEVVKFYINGLNVFRKAVRGEYRSESEEIASIRREMLEKEYSPLDDKKNLRNDFKNVEKDIRTSFNRLAHMN